MPTLTKQQQSARTLDASALPGRHSLSFTVIPAPEGEITELADLAPAVRAAKFRELAFQAKCSAARAEGAQRQTLMDSAGIWQRLANLAEQEIAVNEVFDKKA